MAEKITGGYRERIMFTDHAWARIERLSDRLGLDERTTLRMLVALQLAQLEATFGAAESVGVRAAVEQDMTEGFDSFLEDAPPPKPGRAGPVANPGRPRPVRPRDDEPQQQLARAPQQQLVHAPQQQLARAPQQQLARDDGQGMRYRESPWLENPRR